MLHTTPEAIDAHLNILDSLDVEDAHFVETFCTICYNSRISNSYTSQLADRHYVTTTCKLENELSEIGLVDRCSGRWKKSWPCTVPVISDSSPRPRFPRFETTSRDLRLLCSRPSSLVVVSRDDLPILRGSNIWQRKLLALHPYRDNKAVYEMCIHVHQETLSVQWILLHIT